MAAFVGGERRTGAWPVAALAVLALLVVWAAAGVPRVPLQGSGAKGAAAGAAGADARVTEGPLATGSEALARAFRERRDGEVLVLAGSVRQLLPDERQGPRRQRFLLGLTGGRTVLVERDLERSARIPLEVGDALELRGVYSWSSRGGILREVERAGGGWVRRGADLFE